MARRWCNIPKTFFFFLCKAPDFDRVQDCWHPHDSVFIPMCKIRYISKPKNKKYRWVSGKTDSRMSFLLVLRFSGRIPIWSVGACHVYLSRLSSSCKKEHKEGHLPLFKWRWWPKVGGANSLYWNFIGIPRKPSHSASFSLLLFSGRIPIWCIGTHQAC